MASSETFSPWKEIAAYVGKGVRTVQRWEAELGLPVRRPSAGKPNIVLAVRSEIDEWMASDFTTRNAQRVAPETIHNPHSFAFRVLLVEDDVAFRDTMKAMLESQRYEVLGAGDGFEGLALLREALPDIIISDLRMPNMNGFEFLSVVRHRFPRLPVIAISGEFVGVNVPESVLADAYFEKGSYTIPELLKKMTELLDVIPPRPREGKRIKAPVWIPNPSVGEYVIVTCPDCLRTFPAMRKPELKLGAHHVPCDYCGTDVRFEITSLDELRQTAIRGKES